MFAPGRIAGGAGWLAAGFLAAFGLAAILSIGIVLLVAAAALVALLLSRDAGGGAWTLVGAGIAFAVLGVLSLPWQACDGTSSVETVAGSTEAATSSCGGIHPAIWFTIAVGLALASLTVKRAD